MNYLVPLYAQISVRAPGEGPADTSWCRMRWASKDVYGPVGPGRRDVAGSYASRGGPLTRAHAQRMLR